MAKKKKTKKNGEPTQREKDITNLEKVRFFTKTKKLSQFVKKTDITEINKRNARMLIDELLIPFVLITSRISPDGTPVGRTAKVRKSKVYENVAKDIKSLIDAGVSIFDPKRGEEVSLRFLLDELIAGGATERVETEQTVKAEEKEQKEAEKEQRKKARTEEREKRKAKAEGAQKSKLKAVKDVELVQEEKTQELRQEQQIAQDELQRIQQESIENQFVIASGTESESSSSLSSLASGDFVISLGSEQVELTPEQIEEQRRKSEEEARARREREFQERASGRLAPDVQPLTEEESRKREEELDKALGFKTEEVEEKKTIKIKIVKKIEKGADKSLQEVSERDEKQDEIDVKEGGLSQVPQEQPITQAPENQELQEQQLEENVNNGAVDIAGAALFLQNNQNERDELVENQVEPLPETENVVLDLFENMENKTLERLEGSDLSESTQEIKEKEEKKQETAVPSLLELIESFLEPYKNMILAYREAQKAGEPVSDLMADIVAIRNELYTGSDRSIKTLRGVVRVFTAPGEAELQGQAMRIVENIRSFLNQNNARIENDILIAEAEARTEGLVQEEKEIRESLAKTKKAIREIKTQLLEDGLVMNRDMPPPTLTREAQLAIDSIEEMAGEIKEFGVTDQVLINFSKLYKVLKFDTQDVVLQVIQNSMLEGDIFGGSSTRVLSGLFMRFLGRLIYNNDDDENNEAQINFFRESGIPLNGRDENVISRLRELLQLVVPRPPPVPELELKVEDVPQPQPQPRRRRRQKTLRQGLSDDIRAGFRAIQQADPQGLIRQSLERTREIIREERKQREIEELEEGKRPVVDVSAPTEEELKDFDELVADMESGARAAALAAAASASTVPLTLEDFVKDFGDFVDDSILPDPAEAKLARDAVAHAPGFLENAAQSIAGRVAPVLQRNRQFRAMDTPLIVGAIASGLLAVMYSHFFVDQPAQPEQPAQRQTIRQGEETTPAQRPFKSVEFLKGEELVVPAEDIDKPQGEPLLRPSFFNVGTDFFNRMYNTPMPVQNSEWAEFDFVPSVDVQNQIELDNVFGDAIRYGEPLYFPKYQKPLAPPSQLAVARTRDTLAPAIQLSQGYAPVFDGAVNIYDNLSYNMIPDEFSRGFNRYDITRPDNSIY